MKYEKLQEKSNGNYQFKRTESQEVVEIFTIEALENEKVRNLEQISSLEARNNWLDERLIESKKIK